VLFPHAGEFRGGRSVIGYLRFAEVDRLVVL
jgi:hypothetical protein